MGTDISSWYLVFIAREKMYWWDYVFCRGKYKHVAALGFDPEIDQWYFYEWSLYGICITKLTTEHVDAMLVHFHNTESVILSALEPDTTYKQPFHPIATCVSAMKHLVKFKSWAWTPTQLFCAYKKAGASVCFTPTEL